MIRQRSNRFYKGADSGDIYFSDHKMDIHILTGPYRGGKTAFEIMDLVPITNAEAHAHPDIEAEFKVYGCLVIPPPPLVIPPDFKMED